MADDAAKHGSSEDDLIDLDAQLDALLEQIEDDGDALPEVTSDDVSSPDDLDAAVDAASEAVKQVGADSLAESDEADLDEVEAALEAARLTTENDNASSDTDAEAAATDSNEPEIEGDFEAVTELEQPAAEASEALSDTTSLDTALDEMFAATADDESPVEQDTVAADTNDDEVDAEPVQDGQSQDESSKAGDALVMQIQELLDDARAAQTDIESAYKANEDDEQSTTVETEDGAPQDAVAEQGPAIEVAEGPKDAALDEIDTMLAEHAEEAIDGDFDTPEDIVAADRPAPQVAGAQTGVDDEVEPMHLAEPDLEGSFEAPEVLASTDADADRAASQSENEAGGDFDSDAADVAAELDSQPELATTKADRKSKKSESSAEVGATAGIRDRLALLVHQMHPSRIGGQTQTLKAICETVNAPLDRTSSATRDMIGYIGLITLFNATCLLAYRLAVALFA